MRERLFELLNYISCKAECCSALDGGRCGDLDKLDRCQIEAIADCLLADGWIRPPCKVGDVCYPLPRYKTPIVERKISRITFSQRNIIIGYYENDGQYRPPLRTRILGEDVFLSREAAEEALKGGEG